MTDHYVWYLNKQFLDYSKVIEEKEVIPFLYLRDLTVKSLICYQILRVSISPRQLHSRMLQRKSDLSPPPE